LAIELILKIAISKWDELMTILYLLLATAIYGFALAIYDVYRVLTTKIDRRDRPGFIPPPEGATVGAPKTPSPGGNMAAAAIIDGSAISQTP
jgi:hypothetical protein